MKRTLEVYQVVKVFLRGGTSRDTVLFVVNIEFQPIDNYRVFSLCPCGASADDISYDRVWFEEELSINGSLGLSVNGIGF